MLGVLTTFLITILLCNLVECDSTERCQKLLFNKIDRKAENCTKGTESFANLPVLTGVHCYNDGTGVCKAFSGRFEFKFNYYNNTILGPIESSQYVDSNGYHERVPVHYDPKGQIRYADEAINWSKLFVRDDKRINLLNRDRFNWCGKPYWPYKSGIYDHKSNGVYNIFFHNKQSCIHNTQTNDTQHYNTRFLHNSGLRIDLDYNPTIFAFQNNRAGNDIRLAKAHRQHWYEVTYKIEVDPPNTSLKYFVLMEDPTDTSTLILGGDGPIIKKEAYANYTSLCMTETYTARDAGDPKNAILVPSNCGTSQMESADLTSSVYVPNSNDNYAHRVRLHNLPDPHASVTFFGLEPGLFNRWKKFAKDGITFSAFTSVPNGAGKETFIGLVSKFDLTPKAIYDEFYPNTYMRQATLSRLTDPEQGVYASWKVDSLTDTRMNNLNYVDDIAYLHVCKSILVIYGPLYNEFQYSDFPLKDLSSIDPPVRSIADLSIWEMANAFFAVPNEPTLYVFHRTNYVTKLKYTCGDFKTTLVTAVKDDGGRYYPYEGAGSPAIFGPSSKRSDYEPYSEEWFFKTLGVFNGELRPEAPDPSRYPIADGGIEEVKQEKNVDWWVYLLIALGVLLIVAMCIACLITMRRRRRRRDRLEAVATTRSGLGRSHGSSVRSVRSGLNNESNQSRRTVRSTAGLSSRSGRSPSRSGRSQSRSRGSAMTNRSSLTSGGSRTIATKISGPSATSTSSPSKRSPRSSSPRSSSPKSSSSRK